jgi:hypothetical protein
VDAPFDVQSLVQPDIFLPSQFVDRHRPHRSSLQRLCYALLDLTLHDLKLRFNRRPGKPAVLNGGLGNEQLVARKSHNFKDALRWVRDTGADDLFSFRSVCEILAIEPDRFRSAILELLRDQSSTREAA